MTAQSELPMYEIWLQGYLGESSLVWFDNFSIIYTEKGPRILLGLIEDQAAMHGVLTRICDLGLTLISFHRLNENP